MRSIALVIALVAALIASAFAQKAEIEAVNAKWIDFFNKGDFAGVASLYTEDATAFPPASGRAAIEALWKSMAEQVSDETYSPRRQATRALRSARDRDLQPQDQGSNASGSHRQVSRGLGEDRKRVEARGRHLE